MFVVITAVANHASQVALVIKFILTWSVTAVATIEVRGELSLKHKPKRVVIMQVSLHNWSSTARVCAVYANVAVSYANDATLTEEVLLEPCSLAMHIEQAPVAAAPDSAADADKHFQASALPLHVAKDHMGLPRPKPRQPGISVQLRYSSSDMLLTPPFSRLCLVYLFLWHARPQHV